MLDRNDKDLQEFQKYKVIHDENDPLLHEFEQYKVRNNILESPSLMSGLTDFLNQHPNVQSGLNRAGNYINESISHHPMLQSGLSKTANFLQKNLNQPIEESILPSLAGGVLEGGANSLASIGNAIKQANISGTPIDKLLYNPTLENIPHLNLTGNLSQDPKHKIAELGGELIGGSVVPGRMYGEATRMLPNLLGKSKVIADALKGAGIGYLTGEVEGMPHGRGLGALFGGSLSTLGNLTAGPIAKSVVKFKDKVLGDFGKQYDSLFDKIKNAGFYNNVRVPQNIDWDKIKKFALPKEIIKLKEYLQNPNWETAHHAKSELQDIIRDFENVHTPSSRARLPPEHIASVQEMTNAQKKIAGQMMVAAKNNPNLTNEYIQLGKAYEENAVPLKIGALNKYSKGRMRSKSLLDAVKKNELFMSKYGHLFPQLGMRGLAKNALIAAGTLGVGLPAANYLSKQLGHHLFD